MYSTMALLISCAFAEIKAIIGNAEVEGASKAKVLKRSYEAN